MRGSARGVARFAAPPTRPLGDPRDDVRFGVMPGSLRFRLPALFLLGIVSFGLTSVLCAVAPDGPFLIVARGLQGATGAILTPAD